VEDSHVLSAKMIAGGKPVIRPPNCDINIYSDRVLVTLILSEKMRVLSAKMRVSV
jgi:hypothetical protein